MTHCQKCGEPTGSREWRPERGDPAKRKAYTAEVPK
jgi:hypothetical protein